MERIAREHLPENIGLEWSGLSYQEKQAGGQTGFVLALVFLFVFLFLAAQYESWIVPIAVLLSLPVATLGAYLGHLGDRVGERYLLSDRSGNLDRFGGEERYLDR